MTGRSRSKIGAELPHVQNEISALHPLHSELFIHLKKITCSSILGVHELLLFVAFNKHRERKRSCVDWNSLEVNLSAKHRS